MQPHAKRAPKDQFDQPWKEILEGQLSQFIAFFVPEAWHEIDWARKPISLNTELRRSRREAKASDRRADNLFKVFLKGGGERFIIIHIEVQSTVDSNLAGRMFEYSYRAWDRHHIEKGRSQGRMQQLRTLLEHRFGPLPEWTVERLGKASPSLLDDWAVRLLDASKVEDVFR